MTQSPSRPFLSLLFALALALGAALLLAPADGASATEHECGDAQHPSGKDRCAEHGGSGTQGSATSDPDDDTRGPERSNGGIDQDEAAAADQSTRSNPQDRDGNNGCGNDQDFEDDNEGLCGERPATAGGQDAQAQQQGGGSKKDSAAGSSKPDDDGDSTTITGDDSGRGRAEGDAAHDVADSAAGDDGEAADVSGTNPQPDAEGSAGGRGQDERPAVDDDEAGFGFGSHGLLAGPGAPPVDGAIATGSAQAVNDAGTAAAAPAAPQPQLPATGTAALTQLLLGLGALAFGTVTLRRTRPARHAPWLCSDTAAG